ncbi:MAG: NifB/NifX family molybdenum-iron cluster-binding protein [Candidatus Hodarchaeota archaeon]
MKIGIPSNGKDLSQKLTSVFGRCPYFIIFDSSDQENITIIPNKAQGAAGGAGIQAAQSLVNQKVEIVIAPRIGPNAWDVLEGAGIKTFTGINGTLKQNIEAFLDGKLLEMSKASGRGFGRGRGMGRGGRGTGRGQNRSNYK